MVVVAQEFLRRFTVEQRCESRVPVVRLHSQPRKFSDFYLIFHQKIWKASKSFLSLQSKWTAGFNFNGGSPYSPEVSRFSPLYKLKNETQTKHGRLFGLGISGFTLEKKTTRSFLGCFLTSKKQ